MKFEKAENEKLLVRGSFIDVVPFHKVVSICCLILLGVFLLVQISTGDNSDSSILFLGTAIGISSAVFFVLSLISALLWISIRCSELVITDKRIYLRAFFRRTISIPLDKITAFGSRWRLFLPDVVWVRGVFPVWIRVSLLNKESIDEVLEILAQIVNERSFWSRRKKRPFAKRAVPKLMMKCFSAVFADTR